MKTIINKIARRFSIHFRGLNMLYDKKAKVGFGAHKNLKGIFHVGNSKVVCGNKFTANGIFRIGDNCDIKIGNNCSFENVSFIIKTNNTAKGPSIEIGDDCRFSNCRIVVSGTSVLEISKGVYCTPPEKHPSTITVDNGTLILAEKTNIKSSIIVRFGGKLSIGSYTAIGYNTEIRCEEQISIGSYNLYSYNICIYDTNTHSTNWEDRRKRIVEGYPKGTSETDKPETKPILLGDDIWIGKNAIITKGTTIGSRSIIGIGAIIGGGTFEEDSIIVCSKPRVIKE
jgi:acetyltransferase-like isoleucine patch superfamily enzyme